MIRDLADLSAALLAIAAIIAWTPSPPTDRAVAFLQEQPR